jgi:hypothetical protein
MEETMPETGSTPESTPTVEQVAQASAKPAEETQSLGDPGKKALSEERAARRAAEKANADLQAQLDEIRKSQMSDLEKAQTTAAEFQKAAEKATADALRWRIAAKHGISDEDAETFLTGTDEATLTKQAERLSALNTSGPATPKPDRSQGGSGQPPALNSDGLEQALMSKLGIG